jgi:hypothetical protein
MEAHHLPERIKVHEKDETVEWRGRTLTVVTDRHPIEVLQRYPSSVNATRTRVVEGDKFDFDTWPTPEDLIFSEPESIEMEKKVTDL